MKYIADLHIHSPFSRATSKNSNLTGLYAWAKVKGINIVGTGDFTHPGWFAMLKENLLPAEPGFFRLKDENVPNALDDVIPAPIPVRFTLTSEISCIYKKNNRVRKIHAILYVPDLKSAENINARLAAIGNIESDGRPILGLDVRNLLEILLEQAPEGFMVPAHIWTPWFSLFGSKSGFDSIDECFDDLKGHIFALETGLSSDPEMNRLISTLDSYTLISNSDCHSPSNLGREANMFDTKFDFFSMRDALKNNKNNGFTATIEFFPEEGKYHLDGHRKCNVCLEPEDTRKVNSICPVCNSPLTVGVMHRVMELADRKDPIYADGSPIFKSLIPLPEILGEIMNVGRSSKRVLREYSRVISIFGSDFNLLLNVPPNEIEAKYSTLLGEAVRRIRKGKVIRKPGFDGEFGVIKVFNDGELDDLSGQLTFFPTEIKKAPLNKKSTDRSQKSFIKHRKTKKIKTLDKKELNKDQLNIVQSNAKNIIVSAGPGTGKTSTLIAMLCKLLNDSDTPADKFVAITFTNRAAEEIQDRLLNEIGPKAKDLFIGTFHSFCLKWLRKYEPNISVIGEETRSIILRNLFTNLDKSNLIEIQHEIYDYYHYQLTKFDCKHDSDLSKVERYLDHLKQISSIDIEAIIPYFVNKIITSVDVQKELNKMVSYLFVDEFQDLNSSQYKLVKLIANKAAIFAIGDPNQSIYGFRGSNLNFFYLFSDEHNASRMALTRNYRSAPAIIEAATSVIANNCKNRTEALIPNRDYKTLIEHYVAKTPKGEADFVAGKIEDIIGGIEHIRIHSNSKVNKDNTKDKSFKDIAVLYRLNAQADALKESLETRGIPFQLIDSKPFFMSNDLKAVYYWIRTTTNRDVIDFISLIKCIKGIGNATINKLEKSILSESIDFLGLINKVELTPKSKKKLTDVIEIIDHIEEKVKLNGLATSLNDIMTFLTIDSTQPNSKRFIELAGVFGDDIYAFSNHLKQNAASTVYNDKAEAVSLMSLHAAKGLEFPVVFITGLEEGLLPCNVTNFSTDLEEERRLFYVGLTRAQDNIILSSSAERSLFGKTTKPSISRFVDEIPLPIIKRRVLTKTKKKKPVNIQLTLFDTSDF